VPDYYDCDPCACGTNKAGPDGYCFLCRDAEYQNDLPECGKYKYTKEDAQIAVFQAQSKAFLKDKHDRQECRWYYCVRCEAYHLTSKPKR